MATLEIKDFGRCDMGIVTQIKDLDNAPTARLLQSAPWSKAKRQGRLYARISPEEARPPYGVTKTGEIYCEQSKILPNSFR